MKTKLIFVRAAIAAIILFSLQKANAQNWLLTGNASTNPSSNFLGTTDAKPLILRTKNVERMRILGSGTTNMGYIGIGVSSPIQRLDVRGNINMSLNSGLYINNTRVLSNIGTANFFAGDNAGLSNTTGSANTANGYESLYSNTTGSDNTANGYKSLYSNTTGNSNTATGEYTLYSNTTGYYNLANGSYSLFSNTTGTRNIANGFRSLYSNSTGGYNTSAGFESLYSNTSGNSNTSNGFLSLFSNTTGNYNTAIGEDALQVNETGSYNTTLGGASLSSNTSGYSNTANGFATLLSNTTGYENVGIGSDALINNTTGFGNTACGNLALRSNTVGSYNTGLGYYADVSAGNLTNSTAIGYGAFVNESNRIRLGNAAVTEVDGAVYVTSDGRFKTNIHEEVRGLSFINKLHPVVYNFQARKFDEFLMKNISKEKRDSILNNLNYKQAEAQRRSGFIAQEVEKAARDAGYNFDGVHVPDDDNDNYSLSYAEFVVPLVKAVQELSKQNDSLREQNESLEKRVDKIEQMLALNNTQQSTVSNAVVELANAKMEQNTPNPFNSNTVIKYYIPSQINNAQIVISDANGHRLKTFDVSNKGAEQIILSANTLSSGSYFYSLLVNGKKIDAKQMVLTK